MARPKSNDKRNAILAGATRVIVAQGLGAPTAGIAREAGVANGSLFTYFETKEDLLNALFLELKMDMATAIMRGLRSNMSLRQQLFHVWKNWMNWSLAFPEKRRALAQLNASDEIAPATRVAANRAMVDVTDLLARVRKAGSMRRAPLAFVLTLANSVAEAMMHFIANEPALAKTHCRAGFEALWRMIA